jgi:hypothetical protein
MSKPKIPLIVICGNSVENKQPAFWALDTSDTRLFSVPENIRVDVLTAQLFDFIGKDVGDDVIFKPTILSRRGEQIVQYITKRMKEEQENE